MLAVLETLSGSQVIRQALGQIRQLEIIDGVLSFKTFERQGGRMDFKHLRKMLDRRLMEYVPRRLFDTLCGPLSPIDLQQLLGYSDQ